MNIGVKREKIGPYDTLVITMGNVNLRIRYSDFEHYSKLLGQRQAIIRFIEEDLQRAEIHFLDII